MLWKFILVNSNDLSHIGELSDASGKKIELALNKAGAFSFTYPMDAKYAASIVPYKSGVKAMRLNRTASAAAGHQVWDCVWSGYVLAISETVDANKMSVSCVGWLQRLARRMVRRDKIYSSQDDGAIVQDLLAEVNLTTTPDSYAVPIPAGSSPNTPTWLSWGGTQPNEGAGGATAYTAVTRSKTVQKYSFVLPTIEELCNIENGGDIVVDPLTRVITWHRRYRRVKDDVVFGFRWGPGNVRALGRNIDTDSQINYIVVSGAPASTPQYADDTTQQSQIGLLEENIVLSDVIDNGVMLAYAGAEIIVRSNGQVSYAVQPFPLTYNLPSNVPEPLQAYRVGDQVRFTAISPPRVNIRGQAIRVFGINIDIDENGLAVVQPLQVAP